MVTNHPLAEIEITEALVHSLLLEQMPDLADLERHFVANGWDNAIYRLGPTPTGESFTLRLPRREAGVALVLNEQRWLPVIEPLLTMDAPIPLRIGVPGAAYPWPWSLCRWIDGRPALERQPDDAKRAAQELGGFLSMLHVRAPVSAPENPYRGVPLADRVAGFESSLDHATDLTDVDRLRSAWSEVLETPPWTGPPLWLHGDMHPLNLLVHDGRFSGVIDFGDLTSGDPASDLAVAWMLWPDDPGARAVFRNVLPHDDATWERARGWALALGLVIAVNAADRPTFGAMALRTIDAALTP